MYSFKNTAELVELAQSMDLPIWQIMLSREAQETGLSEEEIFAEMSRRYQIMKTSAHKGTEGVHAHSGFTGGDARKMRDHIESNSTSAGKLFSKAIMYAISTNEVNASMGLICATPTAGSAGVLPGALIAYQEEFGFSDEEIVKSMFTAGAYGFIIANNAFVSGAAGGCQAEIGSASAMTAGALAELLGADPNKSAHAMAMALKNLLGLTCDPLGGLVEVPCIKRNAAGTSIAIMATELAMAGIESKVPWDEVIASMHQIGMMIHVNLRETSLGGLADSETGRRWKQELADRKGLSADPVQIETEILDR